jgi:peptidoglycan/LPS O-acetylase OafA/YrhL
MPNAFSLYLDILRFSAALLVCLTHLSFLFRIRSFVFELGHESVIVFFVLSGYVIAYVAEEKEKTFKSYAISRMARIYSVVVPAVAITILLDVIGYRFAQTAYPPGYQAWSAPVIRIVSSLLFLDKIWFIDIQFFSNVPYWSIKL